MSEVTIWVESGQLCIGCGRSLWRGDVEGAAVLAAVQLNDAGKAVLLLDQESGQGDLVCVDSNAKVLWRATHPGDQDWWTSVQVVSGRVLANTWFGFRLELDSENGECLSRTFVK
jgi:hypothetical protein